MTLGREHYGGPHGFYRLPFEEQMEDIAYLEDIARQRRQREEQRLGRERAAWLAAGPPRSCDTPEKVAAWERFTMGRVE